MNEALVTLLATAPEFVASFSLVFLRIGAALFVLPAFGEMLIPLRVRLAGAFAFSSIVYPAVQPIVDGTGAPIVLAGFGEVITGLALGMVLRIHIMAIQVAASMAAQATSLAQLLGGNSVDPQPAIGMVLYLAALALAVELGLHVQFAMMFIASYDYIAAGSLIGSNLANVIKGIVSASFQFAFVLAAPFVAVSLVYNLALGVINRAMPQLMVAFVGAPAITYGALVLLALVAPLMLALWVERFQVLIRNPLGAILMADEEEGSEKPFEATPRKLEEARKRGEVPISQDLVTFGVYVGILLAGSGFGLWSITRAGEALMPFLSAPETLAYSATNIGGRFAFGALIWTFVGAMSVWLVMPFVTALLAAFAQGAFVFAPVKLKPKLNRISPINNAKQKYGPDGIFNFLKSFAKLIVYSLVLALLFMGRINEILAMPSLPALGIITLTAEICFRFLIASAAAIFVFAIIDYLWQRAQFLRRQRMSLKELKDETKETEGDPTTKQARRQKGYDIATNQMLADVPNADVVVVNPEHYAVALRWDRLPGTAPICVAKGVDAIAARIREVAIESGVPIYRDPPTARALHGSVEIGDEIPVQQYQAIASAIRFADAIREKARKT